MKRKLFLFWLLPALFAYISILLVSSYFGIQPSLVLRDLIQTCEYPIAVGMLSNIGILFWGASSAISFFTFYSGLVVEKSLQKLILMGGSLSLLLCIDDLFLLHDKNQILQDILYSFYIGFIIFLFLLYKSLLLSQTAIAFRVSATLLGLSVFSDIFQDFLIIGYDNVQILEEGFKFLGIISWLAFWSTICVIAIKGQKVSKYG